MILALWPGFPGFLFGELDASQFDCFAQGGDLSTGF